MLDDTDETNEPNANTSNAPLMSPWGETFHAAAAAAGTRPGSGKFTLLFPNTVEELQRFEQTQ